MIASQISDETLGFIGVKIPVSRNGVFVPSPNIWQFKIEELMAWILKECHEYLNLVHEPTHWGFKRKKKA